ncbi:unnamed protein product, partial [Effrenium voratum]
MPTAGGPSYEAMKPAMRRDVPAVCEQIHIPFQSGDDEVLRRMERGYTATRYRQIVERIRSEIPTAGLSADAIVGFPGETEEQFQRTLELVQDVGFLTVNLAAYSPRPNTAAASWPDQVPEEVKKGRLQRLMEATTEASLAQSHSLVGEVHEILLEAPHKRPGELRGRLRNGRLCSVRGPKELLGSLVPVRITDGFRDSDGKASQASGESDGSLTPRRPRRQRWQRSSDYEVEFTPDMLKGLLMGPVWRRVVYTLHQPWVNADVHLFTIGKDRKVLGWSIEFIDLLISMFQ